MKLYVHRQHIYEDLGAKRRYQFNENTVADVPDYVGMTVLGGHPGKFCDVTDERLPEDHQCPKSPNYSHEMMEASSDRMMRPHSRGRR